jgi:ATP/maltotriose-dependent transcriptional regulator MalT
MATPLLATKLYIPRPRPDLVPRPRLIQQLDEGLRLGRKLTLVSAPAGFGKTTLVSEWVAELDSKIGGRTMKLTSPKKPTWWIAVVLDRLCIG